VAGRETTHSDKSDALPETDVPAIAYVRMSTDHQKYSTENQLDVIRNYADARGQEILRVLRLMPLTSLSAASFDVPDFLFIFAP